MNCPVCHIELKIAERQGIEIDYCPQCRGIWLDRGELDKIIERSATSATAPMAAPVSRPAEYRSEPGHDYRRFGGHDSHKKHKRESFLGDLFDF